MTTYSHSRLSTYETCPLAYRYRYIDRIKPEEAPEGIEAFMGSRVHETLEKLYRDLILSKQNSLDDILAYYADIWHKSWHENVVVVKDGYTPENYYATGARAIWDYYVRYAPFDDSKTIGLELKVPIDIDGYRLVGYIDRLSETEDGHYQIRDYKTSGTLPTQRDVNSDRQLALYQIGLYDMRSDVEDVDLIWHYLVFDKEIRSKRTEEELNALKCETVELIQTIERAEEEFDFPAKESPLCRWCEFQALCPSKKHIVETERMPVNEFLNEQGVSLVNRYVAMLEEKRKVESQIDQLRKALIRYSKDNACEVIRGSDRKVKVRHYSSVKYPTKSDPRRSELEELLKEAGVWLEVSALSPDMLAKAVENRRWDEDIIEAVSSYASYEESYRISVSKLKRVEE
ncbi:MAG: RecB family exonuclease [Methermicoccaceae archaeon]